MQLLAITMMQAILAGARYPPEGVADTPEHRALWDELAADMDQMRERGIVPDIPAD